MSLATEGPIRAALRHELEALRGNWLWFVLLGVALIVVGFVSISYAFAAGVATAMVLGAFLLVGGVVEIVGSSWCRGWSGFFLSLLSGILSLVVGLLFLRAPLEGVLALTLLLAAYLLVEGIFEIVAALSYRFGGWGWALLSGLLNVVLGLMIWFQWPFSGLWVIGLFVGISFVFRGARWIALGLGLKTLIRPAPGA